MSKINELLRNSKLEDNSVKGKISVASQEKSIPYNVLFEITWKCNLICTHCYNFDRDDRDHERSMKRQEMSTAEVCDTLDQLADAGTLHLTLTGGEVLTRRDFFEILEHARSKAFAINILTNGVLVTPEVADRIAKHKPWEVGISILGGTPETHDKVTRIPGSFKRAIRAIEMLKERGVRVNMKTCLMDENVKEHKLIEELGDRLDVKYTLDPLVTPRADGKMDTLESRISDADLYDLFARQSIDDGGSLTFATREYDDKIGLNRESIMCKAGINFCNVDPLGNIYPCVQLTKNAWAGNLREASFKEIWTHAPLFLRMRRTTMKDVKVCGSCDLIGFCFRCPGVAALEDGDAFGPSSTACRQAEVRKRLAEDQSKDKELSEVGA